MYKAIRLLPTIIFIFLVTAISGQTTEKKQESLSHKITGYIPQRSVDRMTPAHFDLITDAVFFGTRVDNKGNIKLDDVDKDLKQLDVIRGGRDVDLSVCFGGWERSKFFEKMSASKSRRKNFCNQVLEMCQKYNLDGIDLDWEYPSTPKQRKNFVKLVKDLHETLNPHNLFITIAVGHWEAKAKLTAQVEPYISGVNLMLYDNVDPVKGHASLDLVKEGCERFINHGIPAEKIFAGVPFYGRHKVNRLKTKAYREINNPAENISNEGWHKGYFFNPPEILAQKAEYVKQKGLGGIMIWELGHDVDPKNDKSLLKAIHNSLVN